MSRKRESYSFSVYQRRSDKRWVGAIIVKHDGNGKPDRRVVYGTSRKEAYEKVKSIQRSKDEGQIVIDREKVKVREYMNRWLAMFAKPKIAATTALRYEGLIRTHINPHVGGIKMIDLDHTDIENLLHTLEKAHASARTRQMVCTILRTALAKAVRDRLITFNWARDVPKPRHSKKGFEVWDQDQANLFLQHAAKHGYGYFYPLYVLSKKRLKRYRESSA